MSFDVDLFPNPSLALVLDHTPFTLVPGGTVRFPAFIHSKTGYVKVDPATITASTLRYCRQMTINSDISWRAYILMHEPLLPDQDSDPDLAGPVQLRKTELLFLWQLYARVIFINFISCMECDREQKKLLGRRAQVSDAVAVSLRRELFSWRIT